MSDTDFDPFEGRDLDAEADESFKAARSAMVGRMPHAVAAIDSWPTRPDAAVVLCAFATAAESIVNATIDEARRTVENNGDPAVIVKALTLASVIQSVAPLASLLMQDYYSDTESN